MPGFVVPTDRDIAVLKAAGMQANARTSLYFPGADDVKAVVIESPAALGYGYFKIDFLGAFSYLGLVDADTIVIHTRSIGRFCSIASGVSCGAPEHPTNFLSSHPVFYGDASLGGEASGFIARNRPLVQQAQAALKEELGPRADKVQIGNDVWIGESAFIRRGVTIGDGAVIAARAVVTRDVPPYAIVAGSPARIVRYRFEPAVIAELLRLQWWNYGLSAVEGADFTDVHKAIATIERRIASGEAQLYAAPLAVIGADASLSICRYDGATQSLVPVAA